MRCIIICLALLATIPISDWLADQQIARDKRAKHHEETAYTKAQASSMDAFIAFQLKPSPSKLVYRWANKRAAMIAEAYSLRPEDLDSTVDVRRMK